MTDHYPPPPPLLIAANEEEDEEESSVAAAAAKPAITLKQAIENVFSEYSQKNFYLYNNDESGEEGERIISPKFNIFKDFMFLVCILLIFIFLSAVTYISASHHSWIKYSLIIFISLIFIYPTITDYFFYNAFSMQYQSYMGVKRLRGFIIDRLIFK